MTIYPAGRYRLAGIPADYINLRAQADAASADLGDLRRGDTVILSGVASGDWLLLTTTDGKRGWASQQGGRVVFEAVDVPTPPYALGVDVSQAQTPLDWAKVKAAGYSFAFVRATQGKADSLPVGVDKAFKQHIDAALSAGMNTGVYHAFLGAVDGKSQAQFYFEHIAPYLDRLSFAPAIDVEVSNGRSKQLVADRLHDMCVLLEALVGRKVLIYTNFNFWNTSVGDQWDAFFAQRELWVANYTQASKPLLPRCWSDYRLWQWSSTGRASGYSKNIDLNRLKL